MPNRYIVRYGLMRHLGEFSAKGVADLPRYSSVIARTPRGTEWGEVLCEATDRTREYLGATEAVGKVLRPVDAADEAVRETQIAQEPAIFARGRSIITEFGLAMQLVDVEQLFGQERILFYYLAENRIDFRELVKGLAREFHARIEMRQIGIRDEAKLLADYGDCGKPTCCNTFLQEMPPVSMKMAKLQKATLDPTKISGRCGRLKCCLRYEYDTYEEHCRELPNVGKWIVTREGKGRVIAQEILAKKLLVSFEDNRRTLVDLNDILTVVGSSSDSRASELPDAPATDGGAEAGVP